MHMITMFSAKPLMISLSISDDDYDVLMSFYIIFCFIFGQIEVIRALALLKKAAAEVNQEFGLKEELADAIMEAAQEVQCKHTSSMYSTIL